MTLSLTIKCNSQQNSIMLSVIYALSQNYVDYAECHYAECHYAECLYAECHYAECHYAECHYAECHYAECHGTPHLFIVNKPISRSNGFGRDAWR
jgi:hypothetical protein